MSDSFATIGAALIAAGIAVVGLILSKENKISEFRQQWIDGLRNDVSALVGTSVAIRLRPIDPQHHSNLSLRLFELEQRVALRFKKDSDESVRLLRAIGLMIQSALWNADDDKFSPHMLAVGNATHVILEAEWKRVKAGEPAYLRTLFWARILVAILSTTLTAAACIWLVELFKR